MREEAIEFLEQNGYVTLVGDKSAMEIRRWEGRCYMSDDLAEHKTAAAAVDHANGVVKAFEAPWVRAADSPDYDADCAACLRGLAHTTNVHEQSIRRALSNSYAD